ncbi:hypothetical protein NQ318_021804 [Aromia moschata]|uniref:Protein yellow n=1 Tax=Aromia moschata TaxID=1265417 RepID=A0AAV8Z5T3_9CUCU|nr:hypothetical protein NQ318_021804 [Aromia moschata]
MKKCLPLLGIFFCIHDTSTSHSSRLEVVNEWNLLDFDVPFHVDYRDIKLENTVFTGLELSDDRIFLATPRLRDGVPATLSTIPRRTPLGSSPILRAIKSDSCNRLWVLDSGVMSSIDNFAMVCQPKLVVFDLITDEIVRTVAFPRQVIRPGSLLTNLIIDEEAHGKCDSAFIYMSDTTAPGLVVYDAGNDRAWRMVDPSFYPDPNFSDYDINGETFTLMDGIVGLTHSPYLGTLFFQPLATDRIFSIPTSRLSSGPQGEFEKLPVSLVGRKSSQGLSLALNYFEDTLYFSPLTDTSVASFNLVSKHQKVLAYDPEKLQFLAEMRWKEDGSLWSLSTRFQRFFKRTISPSEINLRLVRIPPRTELYRNTHDNYIYYK